MNWSRPYPFEPSPDALLIDPKHPHNAPSEEFRTLRTRLNHMQSLQPIHTAVVTSPSPAEGKSFAAVNLALAEAQLAGNFTLLCDFDFRRPIVHNLFQTDRAPGITDYLLGKCQLHEAMRRIGDTNLFIMPAGEAVINPLELLNLKEVKELLDRLPSLFNWIILDSPPLLFAADANLLSTLCHGTILVVRIGATTIDSITRAMQSLCQNNVSGHRGQWRAPRRTLQQVHLLPLLQSARRRNRRLRGRRIAGAVGTDPDFPCYAVLRPARCSQPGYISKPPIFS